MQMKLGFIGDNSLQGVEYDSKFAKEHGFEGLEYNYWGEFKDLTADTVGRMGKIHEKYGIRASMLGLWGWNHLSPHAAERETAHAMLDRAIDFAKMLGAEHLVTGCGDLWGEPVGRKISEFMKVFPPFLEKMQKAGLKPAFYPLHGASFIDSLETLERLWEQMPDLKLKYDPANFYHHGDNYLDVVRRYGPKVGYIHIKESIKLDGRGVSEPAAGMGDIAWGKLFAFLYQHNYTGWLSIEPHGHLWGRPPLREKMLLLTQRYISQFLI